MASAVPASSDPYHPFEEEDVWPGCSSCEGERGVGMNLEVATRVSEVRPYWRRGKKTPTIVHSSREALTTIFCAR
jgi:hypothetical protein